MNSVGRKGCYDLYRLSKSYSDSPPKREEFSSPTTESGLSFFKKILVGLVVTLTTVDDKDLLSHL